MLTSIASRQGRQSWGLGGRDPRFLEGIVVGVAEGRKGGS